MGNALVPLPVRDGRLQAGDRTQDTLSHPWNNWFGSPSLVGRLPEPPCTHTALVLHVLSPHRRLPGAAPTSPAGCSLRGVFHSRGEGDKEDKAAAGGVGTGYYRVL